MVYGYQVHAAIVSTGDTSLCYSIKRYDKENATKLDRTREIIESIPDQAGAYFLMDSWYTNPNILHSCEKKGCFLIGAMKTNRILYPNGQKMSAAAYAKSLLPGQFHPVTVNGRTYLVHRYEGPLNKIPHAVVLLSYPENALGQSRALRVFLCSDSSLEDETILAYYSNRWRIEVMFRSHKRYMGFKSFMVRTVKAFERLLVILCLAHFFFSCGRGDILPFHVGLRLARHPFGIF